MQREEVIARIEAAVPQAQEIKVEGADCDFTAVVLSEGFAGVSPVKRQQQVLAAFADVIASGELHALSVRALTPEEWQKKQAQSLTQLAL
ncbi:BolA/IbaG family iron-sulfur metabolism protein [Mangrovimicrobium sediminis]|uniref:BolA/IbaG family iron-sulfur metabolism protein n=2 Tax=Mangrovimicrobium sediminis TaxID=2562682 RepID=A0A4Z0M7G3_9GAMM|nr:BolA/IbaG family iron-sulfur metabolism protein [Haliea sp. SAOS-164]